MKKESDKTPILLMVYAISNMSLALVGIIVWLSWPIPEITDRIILGSFIGFLIVFYFDWTVNFVFFRRIREKIVMKKRITLVFIPFLVISFLSRFLIAGVTTGEIDDTTNLIGPFFIAITSIIFSLILYYLSKEPLTIKIRSYLQADMFIHWAGSLVIFPPIVLPLFGVDVLRTHLVVMGFLLLKGVGIIFTAFTFYIWSRNYSEVEIDQFTDISWPDLTEEDPISLRNK